MQMKRRPLPGRLGGVEFDGELPARGDVGAVFDELDYQMACQAWRCRWCPTRSGSTQHREVFGATELRPRPLRQLPRPARADHGQRDDAVHPELLRPGRDRPAGRSSCRRARPPAASRTSGSASSACWARWAPTRARAASTSSSRRARTRPTVDDGYYVLHVDRDEHHVRVPHPRPRPGSARRRWSTRCGSTPTPSATTRRRRGSSRPDGRPWTGDQPRGLDYWVRLHDIYQREIVDERDRFYLAMLKQLGIEKGKPFAPDERLTRDPDRGAPRRAS